MARLTPTSHLVGLTKYKVKRTTPPRSSTAGNNHGRPAKFVTYCPECPPLHPANPENDIHVTTSAHAKTASCKHGHIWNVV